VTVTESDEENALLNGESSEVGNNDQLCSFAWQIFLSSWLRNTNTLVHRFPYWKLIFYSTDFKRLYLRKYAADFVEICSTCVDLIELL